MTMRCEMCGLSFREERNYVVHLELEADASGSLEKYTSPEARSMWAEWAESRGLSSDVHHFVPDRSLYTAAVRAVGPTDVVFDVGAGDLRLDVALSERVRKVYAVEIDPVLLGRALEVIGYRLPSNIVPICADGLRLSLPSDVSVVLALIRELREPLPSGWRKVRVIRDKASRLVVENSV
ncbi:MAG: rRNA adenine N-6-methyltransferase family protein, partial [Candidatus Geothermarchaeales archaeon]